MVEVRLQAELTETKAELQRLRERCSVGTTTVHKTCHWSLWFRSGQVVIRQFLWRNFSLVSRAQPEWVNGRIQITSKWQHLSYAKWQSNFSSDVWSSIWQTSRGRTLRLCLDTDSATFMPISITSCSCKRPDRVKTKIHRLLQTGVGPFHTK
jgi:hypothetical protein